MNTCECAVKAPLVQDKYYPWTSGDLEKLWRTSVNLIPCESAMSVIGKVKILPTITKHISTNTEVWRMWFGVAFLVCFSTLLLCWCFYVRCFMWDVFVICWWLQEHVIASKICVKTDIKVSFYLIRHQRAEQCWDMIVTHNMLHSS